MTKQRLSVFTLFISGSWLALSASPASACNECLAGRGSPDQFAGGIVSVGGAAANPFHSSSAYSGSSLPGYIHSVAPSAFPSSQPQSFFQHPADKAIEVGAIGLTRLITEGNNPGLNHLSEIEIPSHDLPSTGSTSVTPDSLSASPTINTATISTSPEPGCAALL